MLPYASKDLIASDHNKQVYRVTRSGHTFCLKQLLFSSLQERNAAYLRTGLQTLLTHSKICRVKRRVLREEQLHMLEIETEWAGISVAELARKKQADGECWTADTLYSLLTSISSALAYAHSLHIPHSHICPTNLFQDLNDPSVFRLDGFSYGLGIEVLVEQSPDYFSPQRKQFYVSKNLEPDSQVTDIWNPYADDIYALGLIIARLLDCSDKDFSSLGAALESLGIPANLQSLLLNTLAQDETSRPSAYLLAQQSLLAQDHYLVNTANAYAQMSSDEHLRYAIWCLCHTSMPVRGEARSRKKIMLGGEKVPGCLRCGVKSDFGYFLHCRKHWVCLDHVQRERVKPCLWQVCWQCEEPKYTELFFSLVENDVDKSVVFSKESEPIFEPLLKVTSKELLKNQCHWCHGPLQVDWSYVPHNFAPAFLCSKNCEEFQSLTCSEDGSCLICSAPINLLFIQQCEELPSPVLALYARGKDFCNMCRLRPHSFKLSCCALCDTCMKENYQSSSTVCFPCVLCGMKLQVAEHGDILRRLALLD